MSSELFPDDRVDPVAVEHDIDTVFEGCNRLQKRVGTCIYLSGMHGLTDIEVQQILKMDPSTERPRRLELQKMGIVAPKRVDEQVERRRVTGRKRPATVWICRVWTFPKGGE